MLRLRCALPSPQRGCRPGRVECDRGRVEIATDSRVEDLEALKAEGYDAVLVAVGTHQAVKLRVPGEDLPGVMRAADFLKAAKLAKRSTSRASG